MNLLERYNELASLTEESQRRDPAELVGVLDKWLKGKGWKRENQVPHWVVAKWFKPTWENDEGKEWNALRKALKGLAPRVKGTYTEQPDLGGDITQVDLTVPRYFVVSARLPMGRYAVGEIQITRRK